MAFPFDIFDEMDQMMGNMFGHPAQGQRRRQVQQVGYPGFPQMPSMSSMMMMPMIPPMPMIPSMSMVNPGMNMGISLMGGGPGSTMSFSSTSISYNGNGRPNVVQSTSNVRVGANGVREEQQTYQNSNTGEQRMRLGRHINQRGHVMDQSRNRYTGQRNEDVEYIGMDEGEIHEFNDEWNSHMDRAGGQRIRANRAIQGSDSLDSGRQPAISRPQQVNSPEQQSHNAIPSQQGVQIIELSDDEDANHHRNNTASEPLVDFPDAEVSYGQRRHIPDNENGSPVSSNSEDSSSGRRQKNTLHNLSKPFKSKKPRK